MSAYRCTSAGRLAAVPAVLAVLAASAVWPGVPPAGAADPVQVSFKLQGCNRDPQLTLPNSDGEFICPDSDYSMGNTGSNWAELDLLPFRLTATTNGPAQTYTIAVTGESEGDRVEGYDAITEPELNRGLSDPTCSRPQVGPQQEARPGIGGETATTYRNVTITTRLGQVCVYDYAMRLALGSSRFPGASLSARLAFEDLDGSPGQLNVSTPVNAIDPQQLSKTIDAARGDGYLWALNKSTVASAVSADTCQDDPTASFTSTIHWHREPVTGAVTWTSTVRATNPSSRALIVTVTDVVQADGDEVERAVGDRVELPAHSSNVPALTHSGSAPSGTQAVSDRATATYIDLDTGVDIREPSTATASTSVRVIQAGNPTAEVTDVTTSGGPPISVDSVTSGIADAALGSPVSRPIGWESGVVSGSGEATLTFTAHLDRGFEGTVTVSDEATLRHQSGEATAVGAADVLGQAADPTITFVKTVDVPPAAPATFRFELWLAGQDPTTEPSIISGPVTIPAGQSQSASITIDVPPSPIGYIYEEEPAPGYVGGGDGLVEPLATCEHLDGVVPNLRLMGTIRVVKAAQGNPAGADATALVVVSCPGPVHDQTLVVPADGLGVETGPIPAGTRCTISEPVPPPGYGLVSITPSEVVVPAGAAAVEVTVTNARLVGSLTVTKVIEGAVGNATRTFPVAVDCAPGASHDTSFDITVPPGETSASFTLDDIPAGMSCRVTEPSVPPGWALVGVTPSSEVNIPPGNDIEVTITNERVVGALVVSKVAGGFPGGADPVFTFTVECDDGFNDATQVDVLDRAADFVVFDGITTGAICTVTEDDEPGDGWILESILPDEDPTSQGAQVTIGDDPTIPVSVTVTNVREVADLTIRKVIEDGSPVAGAGLDFTVDVDCDGPVINDEQMTITVPENLDAGSVTVEGIPVGLECRVTEDNRAAGWELVSVAPSPTTVTSDDSDTVTVTNRRALGELRIVKRLMGPVAGAETSFALALDCDLDDFDTTVTLDVTDGESTSENLSGIPTGVVCTLTETAASPGWALDSIEPAYVTVGDDPIELVAVNRRELGGLEIIKHLLGPINGAATTFSAFLDCDVDAFDQDVVIEVTNGVLARTEVTGIPSGVTCTAAELRIPDEWTVGGVAGGDSVTITGTELITVDVVNIRVTGDLDVVKVLRPGPAETAATFEIALDCDDEVSDRSVPIDVPAGTTSVREAFSGIPTGVTCSVSEERLPADWRLVSIAPAEAIIGDRPREFTVTNRRAPAQEPTPTSTPPGPTAVQPTDDPPAGELPDTGSPMPAWLVVVILVLGFSSIAASALAFWYASGGRRT